MPAGTGLGQTTEKGMSPSELARLEYLENNEYKILYFTTISAATGTITKPTGSTILLDQFYAGGDAIVETLSNGQPTGQSPLTAGGVVVSVSSFDTSGNFTLSGTPSSFDVALVYILKIKAEDYQNLTVANIMAMEQVHIDGSGTANELTYWIDANSLGSLSTATYPSLTELSYVKGLTSPVQTQINTRGRKYFAYDNTTYTYTGTTSPTILKTIYIPAGSLTDNSTLELYVNFVANGVLNAKTGGLYITTNSSAISGGTIIYSLQVSSGILSWSKNLRLTNKNSLSSQLLFLTTTQPYYSANSTTAKTATAFDFSVDQYIHIYSSMLNSGDTVGVSDYQCYIDKE